MSMQLSPVSERFQRFLAAIQPTDGELAAADRRVERIKHRLARDFDVRRFLLVGSHWKATAVRKFSDVDLFVVVSRDEAQKWSPDGRSSTLVTRVRTSVARSYPQTTIRRDRQAVVVRFEQGQHGIDIVPAVFETFEESSRSPLYLIPDGAGAWIRTAPDLQKRYLEEEQARSGRKLKSLVQMLKWWGGSRASTSSFTSLYFEHFVASARIPVGYTYQQALAELLAMLCDGRGGPVPDPLQISEAFRPTRTRLQEKALLAAAKASAARADRAVVAESRGRWVAATQPWASVFNGSFPSRRV